MKPKCLAFCGLWAGLAFAAGALPAQAADEAPVVADAQPARSAPMAQLFLVVKADAPEFSVAAIAPRLSAELHTTVVPFDSDTPPNEVGVVTITWRPTRAELAVTFHDKARGLISRVVPAPADLEEAIRSAVLLASNVVRDDVSDLLGPEASLAPPPATPPVAPEPQTEVKAPAKPEPGYSAVTVSLVHPLSTNANDPHIRTRLNLNLLMGLVGQLDGLQFGGLGVVGGDVTGGQLSLLANFAGGSVLGFQAAMVLNVAKQNFTGLQFSFGLGLVGGHLEGVQGALLGNWVARGVRGGQAALIFNGTQGDVHGLQVAFGLNHASGTVVGGQLAPVNVAGDVMGLQVGLLNVAKQVKGLQVGLVNVADDVKGVPVGLVSVTKSGGVHPLFWFSTESPFNLAIKFATRYTYSAVVASAGRDQGNSQVGPGYLLGAHIPVGKIYFETDIGATYLFGGDVCCVSSNVGLADDRFLARWRALLGVQLARRFALFVGAGTTVAVRFKQGFDRETTATLLPDLFAGVAL